MTITPDTFSRDANGVPITANGIVASKERTYTGAAGFGAAGASTLFTVTGDVIVNVFANCSTLLTATGAATIEIGIAGNTAALVAQATATDIDADEIYLDASPATVETLPSSKILIAGTDIIETIATADVSTGVLTFYCLWTPVSANGNVVAA